MIKFLVANYNQTNYNTLTEAASSDALFFIDQYNSEYAYVCKILMFSK